MNTAPTWQSGGEELTADVVVKEPAAVRIVNHFDSHAAAARYAGNRPQSHGRVLAVLRSHLGAEVPVARALDVGCGTGHSTVALLAMARAVVGLDASRFMLAQALAHPAIEYRCGYAEALPFERGSFDLLTVCSAYHWFDQDRFLREAARVLRVGGRLVLYKVGSTGTIADRPEFDVWRRDVLRVRYPKAARNDEVLTAKKAAGFGLIDAARESLTHRVRHTIDEYVDNLLTHSSLLGAMERQNESVADTREWLRRELEPFFAHAVAEFSHEDWIHVLRRAGDGAARSESA
jgi:ubiquinone/menaquinone biosynthesis C-methylase UbiE